MSEELKIPTEVQSRVRPVHLKQLDRVHDLLKAISDPYVEVNKYAQFVENIPVLRARCIRRAAAAKPDTRLRNLEQVLSLIGNKGLEAELLGVLEDLTVAKADLKDQQG